ncbi:MAG: hypothetical protein ACREE0_20180 [Phenylobacterium sp.]
MISALFAATLVLAQSTAPQVSPAAPANTVSPVVLIAPQPDKRKDQGPDAVVCRHEPVLGSRMAVKRCSTIGQMAMDKIEAQQDLSKMQAKDGYHH